MTRWDVYDFFVRRFREQLQQAETLGLPMVRQALEDLQTLIKETIRLRNDEVQRSVPNDLKPYHPRKPRNAEEIQKLKEEHGDALFVRRVKVNEKCSCGEGYTAMPTPNCNDCGGSGNIPSGTVKCVYCTKCGAGKKSSLAKPDQDHPRWHCKMCQWVDTRDPSFGDPVVEGRATAAKINRAMKLIHDEDVATGKYICKACKGEKRTESFKACPCTRRAKYDSACIKCQGTGQWKGFDDRYCLRQPFNMNSIDQLRNYATARNHRIPRNGLGRDGLQQLFRQTGDTVYRIAYECKLFDQIAGFGSALGIAGIGDEIVRVHTQFMFTSGDGRITTKNPNIQSSPNPVKYPEIAAAWNRCLAVKPTEATSLVRATFVDIHYETFGLEGRDEAWLNTVHQGFESWLLSTAQVKPEGDCVPYSDRQVAMAREAIFGFMRERTATYIHQRNRHLFSGVGIVEHLLNVLNRSFPRSVEFKGLISRQAHKQKFLMSKFGYKRDFYNVIRADREGVYSGAGDLSNAVSFLPSNHAYSTMALALRGLNGSAPGVELVNVYDDGFLFEVDDVWLGSGMSFEDFGRDLSTNGAAGILTWPNGQVWHPRVKIEELK